MASTYRDLRLDVRRDLEQAGSQTAEFDSWEIVAAVTGKSRAEQARDETLYVGGEVVRAVQDLTRRRRRGEPLAYVLGEWSFRKLDFYVSPDALIPRQETEILGGLAIKYLSEIEGNTRVLDLCAGTGCLGISIAYEVKNCRAVLVELSDGALELCRRNIRRHKLTGRVVHLKGDALLPPSPTLGQFDVLVCNPPYITTGEIAFLDESVTEYEPIMALDGGRDGLDFYRAVTTLWKPAIKPGGHLIFEVGSNEQADQVGHLMLQAGFRNILITRDYNKIHRIISGRLPKPAASAVPPEGEKQEG